MNDLARLAAQADEAALLLKQLGNPRRLMILCVLTGRELSVTELNQHVPLSQSALSQHLAILRETGLVATRRSGQSILYRVSHPAVADVLTVLKRIYCSA